MTAIGTPVYSPIVHGFLYLTEDCNLRCEYCFVHKKPRRIRALRRPACKAVRVPSSNKNISGAEYRLFMTFFGGEPFIELDRMEEVIMAHLPRKRRPNTYKKVFFTATTNGTIATPQAERVIRDAGISLLLSLDGGHGTNAARPFVSGRSSYDVVARNLPRLASWSPDLGGCA